MNKNCDIVRDILPLYVDEVCSEESRRLVDEHVSECPECSEILEKLKNNNYVDSLKEEGEEVIFKHAKKEKRKAAVAGSIVAAVLMVPILVCMIVNLATGHGLTWFFIVFASLLIPASLSVVPLTVTEHKGLYTLGAFTASILVLFAVLNIYGHGHWFFIASFGTLLGLSVFFMPFVSLAIKEGYWSRHRALLCVGLDTAFLLALLGSIGLHAMQVNYWRISGAVVGVILVFVWLATGVGSANKINKSVRAGLIWIIIGTLVAAGETLILWLLGYTVTIHAFRPLNWYGYINSNVKWIVLIVSIFIGCILMARGFIAKEKEKENENA